MEENRDADGTFKTTLLSFLWNPLFPASKRAQIYRYKRNDLGIDLTEGKTLFGNADQTPTDTRNDPVGEATREANVEPDTVDAQDDGNDFGSTYRTSHGPTHL